MILIDENYYQILLRRRHDLVMKMYSDCVGNGLDNDEVEELDKIGNKLDEFEGKYLN